MVPREQFDSVCRELEQALSRERRAQDLLREQGRQVTVLSERHDKQALTGNQQSHELADALQVG